MLHFLEEEVIKDSDLLLEDDANDTDQSISEDVEGKAESVLAIPKSTSDKFTKWEGTNYYFTAHIFVMIPQLIRIHYS